MAGVTTFPLDAVRTDGWFERIGVGIGSFQALCEIVGERFFAFSMITGARITAVTVDRRNPEQTLVDFTVGVAGPDEPPLETQRLTLGDFRRRLVGALLTEEDPAPAPTRETDLEGLQLHIGVRYLLLAPLYGYSLVRLDVSDARSELSLVHDGIEERHELMAFRLRIRAHVRDELDRAAQGGRSAIDLGRVAEAEFAALAGDDYKIVQLLGSWPAPLAIFLRTPEGQSLTMEPRAVIAKGLGLLGTSCVRLGDVGQGEEIFRLAIQYAQDGPAAADIFLRLGSAVLGDGRPGEAVGPLRRAIALGANPATTWPLLATAFKQRGRFVAALACAHEAMGAGVAATELGDVLSAVSRALGPSLDRWPRRIAPGASLGAGSSMAPPPAGLTGAPSVSLASGVRSGPGSDGRPAD